MLPIPLSTLSVQFMDQLFQLEHYMMNYYLYQFTMNLEVLFLLKLPVKAEDVALELDSLSFTISIVL